ncbi:helix-turn-helix domain-containing protein [Paraclostridium bifermentans]|uniref:helix-turn-helix domain-containing protein n=1 Tax=Paraclostridium bifermentans TaxID=1490 RepID=UPI0025B25EC9|nr:helix-turn-helix transcriptional regulator [Paraclostridium bifermentans]
MKNLKTLRENKGYSKVYVSRYLGVTPESIGYMEKVNRINIKHLDELSKLYSIDLESLTNICEIKV